MTTELPQDTALLIRIQQGDRAAFAALVEKHFDTFYGLAYRYMQQRETAEDMVQTAFLKLWEYPDKWDANKGVRFTTWFYRVVTNICLDSKRKHTPSALPENIDVADDSPSQETLAIAGQTNKMIEQQLALLPDRQRMALILCFYQELSHQEAAEVMKVSIKALRSLLMRAKTTLREQLTSHTAEVA